MQAVRRMVAGRAAGGADNAAAQAAAAAWAAAFQRAVAAEIGLDLAAGPARAMALNASDLPEVVADRALLCRLEDGRGRTGVLALAPDLLAVLLERLTLGRVEGEAPPPRRPTRTDAAMVAGAVDAAFTGLGAGTGPAQGLRYAAHLVEVRSLPLVLDEGPLQSYAVEFTVPGRGRGGLAHLAVPAPAAAPVRAAAGADPGFSGDLAEQVQASTVLLDAVVARVTLPLAEVLRLTPGDWLRLGTAALDRIDLQGVDGLRRAGGRLGQNRGMRAVRMAEAAQPAGRSSTLRLPVIPRPEVDETLRPTGT